MKNLLLLLITSLLLAACATYIPPEKTNDLSITNPNISFRYLGFVHVEFKQSKGGDAIRSAMLKAAKRKFPEANDVVDLITTQKIGAFNKSQSFIVEGRAIAFN